MKKLNFLSKVCGLSRASQYCDVSVDRRFTVGSPSVLHRLSQYIAVTLLLLVVGVGNAWGATATWALVTSEPSDWSGEYLIVYGDGCVDGSLTSSFDQHTRISVTITNNKITLDDSYSITIAKSSTKYSLRTASGYYFGRNANSNGMDFNSSWSSNYTVVFNNWNSTNKTVQIAGNGGRCLGRNGNVWRFYSSGNAYTNVSLYKKEAAAFTVTASSNNNSWGTVSVSGTTITATPADCYQVVSGTGGYTLNSGTATITHTGTSNTLSVTPTSNCSITVNFEKKTVNTYIDEIQDNGEQEECGTHSAPTLTDKTPATSGTCAQQHWHFVGWVPADYKASPRGHITNGGTSVTADGTTYYAVWSKGSSSGSFDNTAGGDFYIYATVSGTNYYATSISSNKLQQTTNVASATKFTFTKISNGVYSISDGSNYLYNTSTTGTNLATRASSFSWTISNGSYGSWRVVGSTRALIYRASSYNYFGAYTTGNVNGTEYFDVEIGVPATYSDSIAVCCNPLGTINGSLSLTQGGNSVTISGWTYNAGATSTTESNIASYTVRMYKKNGGGTWDLVSGTASGGSAGTAGTRTGIATNSKSVTFTGLVVESEYKFTIEAVGNTGYCDIAETDMTSINSTDVSSTPFKFRYSIYIDNGSGSGWAHNYITPTENADEGSVEISLTGPVDYYQFKIAGGFSGWWGQTGTGKYTTSGDEWTLNGENNVRLQTWIGGTYTFTVDYSGTTNPKVTISYPSANQNAGNIVYWDASVVANWDHLYFRAGTNSDANAGSDCKTNSQKVPGTDNFYKVTTASFTGMGVWAIANNTGWTGANTNGVYKTKTGDTYAVTLSSEYQDYVVDETGVTLVPYGSGSMGSQSHDNNCRFYAVTKTDGMLTHTATITTPSNGTITLAYTDVNSTSQSKTATTSGLAHRTILTITATPDSHYELTSLTVGGEAFISGNTYILDDDVTIAATFSAVNYTVTWHVGDVTSTSSVAYNTEFKDISVGKPSPADNALADCGSTKFIGWVKAGGVFTDDGKTATWYDTYKVSATDKITGNTDFYAMYAEASSSSDWTRYTKDALAEGDYLIVQYYGSAYHILKAEVAGSTRLKDDAATVSDGVVTVPDSKADYTWHMSESGGYYKFYNSSTGKYLSATGVASAATITDSPESDGEWFSATYSNATNKVILTSKRNTTVSVAAELRFAGTYWACYTSASTEIYLYWQETTYSNYRTGCTINCSHPTPASPASITKTGATISWTDPGTKGTLDHYEYKVWLDGDAEPTTGTSNSKNLSKALTGLYSGVKYHWKVRRVCTGDDGESIWSNGTDFTTTAADLTFNVIGDEDDVDGQKSDVGLPAADVPTTCGDCWEFVGWTTSSSYSGSSEPTVLFPEGTKAHVSGDATLYAVYGRYIVDGKTKYRIIDDAASIIANNYYVLTIDDSETTDAVGNANSGSYSVYVPTVEVSVKTDATSAYIEDPANTVKWKFTGTALAGRLYNETASKYIDLHATGDGVDILNSSTTDYVNISVYDAATKKFNVGSNGTPANYLQYFEDEENSTYFWGIDTDHDGYFSCRIFKRTADAYATTPSCEEYAITWKVGGVDYSTGSPTDETTTCTGIETLPTAPSTLACADEFIGWSEQELTGTGNSAPTDLFTITEDAPVIDEAKTFHAVFADVLSITPNTNTYTINNSGTIDSKWEKTTVRSASAASFAGKTYVWQVYGASSEVYGEINTKDTYYNITNVTINVAASNATTVTLYYSADKSSWSSAATVSVSKNTSSYSDYSFDVSSVPSSAVYLKIQNSTNSLYVYQIKITYGIPTFGNYVTYCSNEFTTAGNWSTTSNWSLSHVPTIGERAIIKKAAVVDVATAKAKEVIIYNDGSSNTGSLEISAGQALVVAETVRKTTNGSTYTATGENDISFSSDKTNGLGALVMGTHDGTNKATVNFYSKSHGAKNSNESVNQFVGTPFNDETNVLYNWYNSWIYEFTNTSGTPSWKRIKDGDGMTPFHGYCIISADNEQNPGHMYWQQGTLVASEDQDLTLVYYNSENTENMFANSWMAPIKISEMNGHMTNTTGTIYIFNSGSAKDGDGSQTDGSAGNYSSYTPGTAGSNVIPAMQAFTVYATAAGSLSLDYSAYVYDPAVAGTTPVANKAPQRTGAADEMEHLKLRVASESGWGDALDIYIREDFSYGFELYYDGPKIEGDELAPMLYAVTDDGKMAINCVPDAEGTVVGFRRGEDDYCQFTFEYDGDETLYLNDLKEQVSTLISADKSYSFYSAAGDMQARFIISRTPIRNTPTGVENTDVRNQKSDVRKLVIDDHVFIIRNGQMYDVTGKRVTEINK